MQSLLFMFAEVRNRGGQGLGVGPSIQGLIPLPGKYLRISGITKDSLGAVLASCVVNLFRTADNTLADSTVSGADGSYEFRTAGLAEQYYVVAYKAGAPDVAGTTVNTLTGS